MAKPKSIDPLKNFSVSPLTAGKVPDAYAKALGGAVTTPDSNPRIIRQSSHLPAGIMKGVNTGLAKVLSNAKVMGQVKGKK